MESKKRWPLTKIEEDKITLDEAKFVFSQGEKLLQESTKVGDIIVSRTIALTSIVAGIATAVLGFSINRWVGNSNSFDSLILTSAIALIYLFWICYTLYLNIKGRNYYHIGSSPISLLDVYFFQSKFDLGRKEKIEKEYYLTEIYDYQKRIDENNKMNNQRWKILNRSIRYTLSIPFVLGSIFIIVNLLTHHHCFSL